MRQTACEHLCAFERKLENAGERGRNREREREKKNEETGGEGERVGVEERERQNRERGRVGVEGLQEDRERVLVCACWRLSLSKSLLKHCHAPVLHQNILEYIRIH